jgi:pyruvate carboxylase
VRLNERQTALCAASTTDFSGYRIMKMEHALTEPRDGIVAEVAVGEGAQVTDGTFIPALEPEDG